MKLHSSHTAYSRLLLSSLYQTERKIIVLSIVKSYNQANFQNSRQPLKISSEIAEESKVFIKRGVLSRLLSMSTI